MYCVQYLNERPAFIRTRPDPAFPEIVARLRKAESTRLLVSDGTTTPRRRLHYEPIIVQPPPLPACFVWGRFPDGNAAPFLALR